jgi:hypothetical protein
MGVVPDAQLMWLTSLLLHHVIAKVGVYYYLPSDTPLFRVLYILQMQEKLPMLKEPSFFSLSQNTASIWYVCSLAPLKFKYLFHAISSSNQIATIKSIPPSSSQVYSATPDRDSPDCLWRWTSRLMVNIHPPESIQDLSMHRNQVKCVLKVCRALPRRN